MTLNDAMQERIAMLRRLGENHDNEGACAANQESLDHAEAFLRTNAAPAGSLLTLDDDGFAVLEFWLEGSGFGDFVFIPNGDVQVYFRAGSSGVLFDVHRVT